MKKFIVKQRTVAYQYVVVEAEDIDHALDHVPFVGDAVVTSSGYFTNLEAKEYKTGDFVWLNKFHFVVVTKKNLLHSLRKFLHRIGWNPYFTEIKEDHLRPSNSDNPKYNRPQNKKDKS
jgi:hypothetical protein